MFANPAETTAANGTRRERTRRVVGGRERRRGIRLFRPQAIPQETAMAIRYEDLACVSVSGVDLFALFELILTWHEILFGGQG